MSGIERARQLLNLSKEYVTKATGYKGEGVPSDKELASLCVLFGVSKEELLKDYSTLTPDEEVIEHLKNFKSMMKERGNM